MPDHAATDNRGQIHLVGETAAVLLVGQEIGRQRETTPGQHRHQAVVAQRTDQTVEGHGRDMPDHRAQLQTEATVGGQQGIAGHLRSHLAIAQDEVGQHGEHRFARGTLETPDGDPTQTDTHIMRVARQASAPATGRFVLELEAEDQEESEHTFDKRLAVFHQAEVGRFVSEIDGDGAVFARRFGCCAHVSPLCHPVSYADETRWG